MDRTEGAEQCAADLQPLRAAATQLNRQRLIDYDQVFQLKSQALECIFKAAPEPQGLTAWVHRQGRALHDFATFNALAEVHGPSCRSQPAYLRHPLHDV